jgi:hypothetical protein
VGVVVLAWSAISARSVALAGFGLDSLIEIGASVVVAWELTGTGESRQHRALRLIGGPFALLEAEEQHLFAPLRPLATGPTEVRATGAGAGAPSPGPGAPSA